MRLVATYSVLGRLAQMRFDWEVTRSPYNVDGHTCAALCANYVTWERGLGGVLGYNSLRSVDSHLVKTEAWGLSRHQKNGHAVDYADVVGEIPNHVRVCLPAALAPVLDWEVTPGPFPSRAKTYAVGYAADQAGSTDLMELAPFDRGQIQSMFDVLQTFMADNGGQLVHLAGGRRAAETGLYTVFPLTGVFNVRQYLGVQRRRERFANFARGGP